MDSKKEQTVQSGRVVSIDALRGFTMFMMVGGSNAIAIYMLTHVMNFDSISYFFIYGIKESLGTAQSLVIALISTALEWLLLYYLYMKIYFIRL